MDINKKILLKTTYQIKGKETDPTFEVNCKEKNPLYIMIKVLIEQFQDTPHIEKIKQDKVYQVGYTTFMQDYKFKLPKNITQEAAIKFCAALDVAFRAKEIKYQASWVDK